MAAETFFMNFLAPGGQTDAWVNHLRLDSSELQAEGRLVVGEVDNVLRSKSLLAKWADEDIDLIVGGPPCQGFSLAGRRDKNDSRNTLPWQFLEVVANVEPKIVIIENVVGMSHRFGGETLSVFQQLQHALSEVRGKRKSLGYKVQGLKVNALHYGAPQTRPRLMIVGVRTDLASDLGPDVEPEIWSSNFVDSIPVLPMPRFAPKPLTTSAMSPSLGDAIYDLWPGLAPTLKSRSDAYLGLLKTKATWGLPVVGAPRAEIRNNYPRNHSETTTERFRLYQLLAGVGLPATLLSDIAYERIDTVGLRKLLSERQIPDVVHDGQGNLMFSNHLDLVRAMISLATRKHSQRAVDWDKPAPTVVTLPDDYIHPKLPRVFTVRELARLQGFSDDFVFYGKETTGANRRKFEVPQYSQVGNAVSPFLGYAAGVLVADIVSSSNRSER